MILPYWLSLAGSVAPTRIGTRSGKEDGDLNTLSKSTRQCYSSNRSLPYVVKINCIRVSHEKIKRQTFAASCRYEADAAPDYAQPRPPRETSHQRRPSFATPRWCYCRYVNCPMESRTFRIARSRNLEGRHGVMGQVQRCVCWM